jgi:hypothetical protein
MGYVLGRTNQARGAASWCEKEKREEADFRGEVSSAKFGNPGYFVEDLLAPFPGGCGDQRGRWKGRCVFPIRRWQWWFALPAPTAMSIDILRGSGRGGI